MTQVATWLEELFRTIGELAQPVLFEESVLPESPTLAQPPVGVRLWRSPYAVLVVCPVGEEDLESTSRSASFWLDDLLSGYEDGGRPMDGYLLLALASKPPPEELGRAGTIEQDPSFCRKHVLWPEDGSWKDRLERVTVFALAGIPSPAEPATIPVLPPRAERAWERYVGERFAEVDNVKAVARWIRSRIGMDDVEVPSE